MEVVLPEDWGILPQRSTASSSTDLPSIELSGVRTILDRCVIMRENRGFYSFSLERGLTKLLKTARTTGVLVDVLQMAVRCNILKDVLKGARAGDVMKDVLVEAMKSVVQYCDGYASTSLVRGYCDMMNGILVSAMGAKTFCRTKDSLVGCVKRCDDGFPNFTLNSELLPILQEEAVSIEAVAEVLTEVINCGRFPFVLEHVAKKLLGLHNLGENTEVVSNLLGGILSHAKASGKLRRYLVVLQRLNVPREYIEQAAKDQAILKKVLKAERLIGLFVILIFVLTLVSVTSNARSKDKGHCSSEHCKHIIDHLTIRSGDIEANPGPVFYFNDWLKEMFALTVSLVYGFKGKNIQWKKLGIPNPHNGLHRSELKALFHDYAQIVRDAESLIPPTHTEEFRLLKIYIETGRDLDLDKLEKLVEKRKVLVTWQEFLKGYQSLPQSDQDEVVQHLDTEQMGFKLVNMREQSGDGDETGDAVSEDEEGVSEDLGHQEASGQVEEPTEMVENRSSTVGLTRQLGDSVLPPALLATSGSPIEERRLSEDRRTGQKPESEEELNELEELVKKRNAKVIMQKALMKLQSLSSLAKREVVQFLNTQQLELLQDIAKTYLRPDRGECSSPETDSGLSASPRSSGGDGDEDISGQIVSRDETPSFSDSMSPDLCDDPHHHLPDTLSKVVLKNVEDQATSPVRLQEVITNPSTSNLSTPERTPSTVTQTTRADNSEPVVDENPNPSSNGKLEEFAVGMMKLLYKTSPQVMPRMLQTVMELSQQFLTDNTGGSGYMEDKAIESSDDRGNECCDTQEDPMAILIGRLLEDDQLNDHQSRKRSKNSDLGQNSAKVPRLN